MKILAFTDLHGDFRTLKKLTKKAKDVDLIVCAGDISVFGRDLDYLFFKLDSIGKKVLIIHGNHETEKEMKIAVRTFKNVKFIHKKVVKHEDIYFMAYGGGGFSKVDKGFEQWAKKNKDKIKKKKWILITHGPPSNTKCDYITREHVGNKSYRKFIEKYKPIYHICGHIHECEKKKDKIGNSKIINPGFDGEILKV